MTFQAVTRTGQTVDKGLIVQRPGGAEPIVVGGSTPASPTPIPKTAAPAGAPAAPPSQAPKPWGAHRASTATTYGP